MNARVAGLPALEARRANMFARVGAARHHARASVMSQAQEALPVRGQICYEECNRPVHFCGAAQHHPEWARGPSKWLGFSSCMREMGSEAERSQAGISELTVSIAALT